MNKAALHTLIAGSTGNESNICQICVLKNGEPVYEDCWHGYKNGDAVHTASVTKSVMALLIGIAVDQGFIRSVDQKVLDFFPDYQVKRREKTIYDVTIRHLLTMTAPYKYRSEPWTKVCTSDDWTRAVLDLLGGRSGITGEFKYATLGIQILAGIIQNAAGESCIHFANKNLFVPLSIPEHVIHGASDKADQFDYLMNKTPGKNEWYSDPKGTVTAGWGLCLSAQDLARIGELVLQDGKYSGRQVVSQKYIKEMLTPSVKLARMFGFMEYGYLWYKPYPEKEIYAAVGDGGNIIYVDKERQLSVGITGSFKPRVFNRLDFIENTLLPAIHIKKPILYTI